MGVDQRHPLGDLVCRRRYHLNDFRGAGLNRLEALSSTGAAHCLGTTSCAHGLSFDGGGLRSVHDSLLDHNRCAPVAEEAAAKPLHLSSFRHVKSSLEAAHVVSADLRRRGRRAARGRTPFDP